jgi:hypothetical protein
MKLLRVRGHIGNLGNVLYSAGGLGQEFFPAAERHFFVGVEVGF